VTFSDLSRELLGVMEGRSGEPLPDPAFQDLAIRIFRFQCRANPAYGGFVGRRGVDPDAVTSWKEIPFLPTRAFKAMPLVSGDPVEVERVFRTSGTTLGEGARGEHHVLDLRLYRGSLRRSFANHVLGDAPWGLTILCLLPSPESAPDSSLAFMMGDVVEAFGGEDSGFFVGRDGEIDEDSFWQALRDAEGAGRPVLLAGTAFGFVRWMELSGRRSRWVSLPEGSRIMETGGYKGRSRQVPRDELYRGLETAFGVEENLIVSEYGVLMPEWVADEDDRTFTPERVRDFMYGSFDYLQNATDPDLGHPALGAGRRS